MICTPIPGGFICGSRRPRQRCACGARAALLCDWKVPARQSGTCDRPICEACASSPAAGKDLCPDHGRAWAAWKAQRRTA